MWFSSLMISLFYLNNYMKINNQVVTMVIGIKWVMTGGSNMSNIYLWSALWWSIFFFTA